LRWTILLLVILFSVSIGVTFISCDDDDSPTEPTDNTQTVLLSDIFPMTVGNQWAYSNLDSSDDGNGSYSVIESTISVEVTGPITHAGHDGFVFHLQLNQDGETEELNTYYYASGDSLYISEEGETEWSWEEDIQGISDKEVGDTLFWERETGMEGDLELEETDLLTIHSLTESLTTDAGTFENCLVLKEEKYDYYRNNGTFESGEHSVEYTYFAKGVGFIKSVDRDWNLTSETEDGALIQYEEEKLTSYTVN